MKILVVSYSRSGNTKKIAEQIAKKLDADFDEVIDMKDRHRKIIGWLIAGKDAMAKEKTEIKYKKDPTEYDLVIVGTPIWAWTMTPAIRTYLTENKFSEVAFFCTYGGNKGKSFEEMELLSKKPIATLELIDKLIEKNQIQRNVDDFCKKL